MILRKYQFSLISNLAIKLAGGFRKLIAQLATGGGKTICFAAMSDRYTKKNSKDVLILVHRKELLQQTRKTLYNAFGIEATAIKAGMKYIEPARVYVGMVESVNRRIAKIPNIGMVIIDEAHIASFNKMHDFFPTQYIIGFTATPLSSSKKRPVNMFYQDIVCGVDIPELIADGHLCQNVTWAPKETVDRLELAMKGGDFDEQAMAVAFSRPKYIHNTVTAYERWSKDKKTIIFNVSIDHSKEVNKAFVEAGYEAKHLDSEMSAGERDQVLYWFKHTPNAILNNVGIATVGFDEPTIEAVIVNKATASMPLWLQMCGRGSRPTEIKSMFIVIDMGGNAITHGDWCQARNWTELFHNPPKPGEEGIAPVKNCPACEAIIPAGARVCPYCGHVFDAREIPIEVDLNDFIIVTKDIDVEKIIKRHEDKKEHYVLFQIGRQLATDAKKTVPKMSDEYANFILQINFDKVREWMKALNTAHGPLKKKKIFNKWYQALVTEFLYIELNKHYPEWRIPITLSASTQK